MIGGSNPLLCNEQNVNDLDTIKQELIHLNKFPTVKHKIDEETQELYVKTNSMMKGYYNNPDKTAEVFTDDGYYKTGDTVHVADDNQDDILKFMVVSRNKHVIVSDGEHYIFPQFIEDQLLSHKMVNGAVVIGVNVNDKTEYKYPAAFVTANSELNQNEKDKLMDELLILCSKRNKNGIPKIFIVDEIPKISVGKIDRNKLTDFANDYFNDINSKENENENKVYTLIYQQISNFYLLLLNYLYSYLYRFCVVNADNF